MNNRRNRDRDREQVLDEEETREEEQVLGHESKRILGRDEPGVFDHDVETLRSFKGYGEGLSSIAGPFTMKKWLGFAIVSSDPATVDAWGLPEAGRCWFNSADKLFKFWDGTKILTIAPMQWFIDNFADASIHWAWDADNVAAGKTVTEASGLLTIAVAGGTDGVWSAANNLAPKVLIGVPGYPCEVVTKLNSYTVNDDTLAGLFVSYNATGTGARTVTILGRYRDDGGGHNGLVVHRVTDGVLASNSVTTLPIWLRLRIGNTSYFGAKIIFSYSTDGDSYTDLYTQSTGVWPGAAGNTTVVGLLAENWGVLNAISAPFESFSASASYGPG